MLGLLGGKFILYAIVALVITTTIGGYWLYQKSLVEGLQNQITGLQTHIAELIIANESLKLSNESLDLKIQAEQEQNKQIREEINNLKTIDDAAQEKLAEYESQLRDIDRRERIERLLKSRAGSLMLRKMDANIRCEIEHFEKVDGKCLDGAWRLTK